MLIDYEGLKSEEETVLKLRNIYRGFGYTCYKMSKFEEYDLYSQNKDFLVSDRVITFTDTNGMLMALKPDVTLSIVKNYRDPSTVNRVYYNENVYRISDKTHCYKEIMQTGVETLGDITEYNLLEVIGLAVKSLETVSEKSVLNVSHLGLLKEALEAVEGEEYRALIIEALRNKNRHELEAVLEKAEAPEESSEFLKYMASAFGEPAEILKGLQKYASSENVKQCMSVLKMITDNISSFGNIPVRIDLSLAGDMNYYNGLIFEGYVEGIPQAVLKGGQYDSLLKKLNKKGGAIGFAVYLDELERLKAGSGYDVDVLLIAGPEVPYETVIAKTNELISAGLTVSVQKCPPKNLIYKEMVEL